MVIYKNKTCKEYHITLTKNYFEIYMVYTSVLPNKNNA